jgi:uncharacterized membrane-anchored protein
MRGIGRYEVVKSSAKIISGISILFALIFVYERLVQNSNLPELFGSMLWFVPVVLSVLFYMIAVTINKGYNKALKIIGIAYIIMTVIGISWYFVIIVMMVTG